MLVASRRSLKPFQHYVTMSNPSLPNPHMRRTDCTNLGFEASALTFLWMDLKTSVSRHWGRVLEVCHVFSIIILYWCVYEREKETETVCPNLVGWDWLGLCVRCAVDFQLTSFVLWKLDMSTFCVLCASLFLMPQGVLLEYCGCTWFMVLCEFRLRWRLRTYVPVLFQDHCYICLSCLAFGTRVTSWLRDWAMTQDLPSLSLASAMNSSRGR